MKAVPSRLTAVSDLFRAIAGAPEAQFDMIANSVYSAAFSIMQAGNKTQFNKLAADASQYGGDTKSHTDAIKAALGVVKVTPAVKHFRKVYFSLGTALDQMGIPELVRDLPAGKAEQVAILDPLASDYAGAFTAIFTATVMMPEKTEAERAAAAAEREAKKAEKERAVAAAAAEAERTTRIELDSAVSARVEQATAPDNMARMVADMLASGSLPAELESMLIDAARQRETALLLARAASAEPTPA